MSYFGTGEHLHDGQLKFMKEQLAILQITQ